MPDRKNGRSRITRTTQILRGARAGFAWDPDRPYRGRQVIFTGDAQGTEPIAYAWDFSDGATADGWGVSHAFAARGDYAVTLTASNSCGEQVAQRTVRVALPVEIYLPLVYRSD